jgi:hypothetical protein
MQEILINRRQFVCQYLVEVLDDFGIALHISHLVTDVCAAQAQTTAQRRKRLLYTVSRRTPSAG